MPTLRLALAQINAVVGDLDGNSAAIREWTERAAQQDADIIAFPEMALVGYPVEDLALRPSFQAASREALIALATRLAADGHGERVVIVGYLDHTGGESLGRPRGGPVNAAAVIHRGEVVARYGKHHLPNYGVFDEYRYFVPGKESTTVRVRGVDVSLAICEDLWQEGGPVAWARGSGLLVVLNGSPYERNKDDVRLDLCRRRAREAGVTLAYVNLVGGQDELVFDGDSLVVDADGGLLARAPQFEQDLLVTDLDLATGSRTDAVVVADSGVAPSTPLTTATVAERLDDDAEVYRALVVGLRDYVVKNGFGSVILGLSGGIDSALVAVLACDALGADRVHGVSLPSVHSSDHSRADAFDLARRTGLAFRTVEIAEMVEAFDRPLGLTGLAAENVQARVRGVTLMALSNAEGHLVLATGNKSEISVGYSTIYGDAVGGFAPIKDVPKTLVWRLAQWRNADAVARGEEPPIPPNSITKPPSAELRPGQMDTDSLPDYALLDEILDDYIERDRSAQELVAQGFPVDLVTRVLRLVDAAEYKRRQYPPGTKISVRAFGRDRRLPITSRWRESLSH